MAINKAQECRFSRSTICHRHLNPQVASALHGISDGDQPLQENGSPHGARIRRYISVEGWTAPKRGSNYLWPSTRRRKTPLPRSAIRHRYWVLEWRAHFVDCLTLIFTFKNTHRRIAPAFINVSAWRAGQRQRKLRTTCGHQQGTGDSFFLTPPSVVLAWRTHFVGCLTMIFNFKNMGRRMAPAFIEVFKLGKQCRYQDGAGRRACCCERGIAPLASLRNHLVQLNLCQELLG